MHWPVVNVTTTDLGIQEILNELAFFLQTQIVMAYREFLDSVGVLWRVWATVPSVGKVLSKGFEKGWLPFESSAERRRLAPIPHGWEAMSDTKLRALLTVAIPTRIKASGTVSPNPIPVS